MQPWHRRILVSILVPGGVILLGAYLLLNPGWINPSVYGVRFFYHAAFLSTILLAWRFHSTRIVLAGFVLLLANRAIEFFAQGRLAPVGPGRIAFEAIVFLIPFNFILLAFFPERGSKGNSLFWFLTLLFFESVFVDLIARPGQHPPTYLNSSPLAPMHSRLPQPALILFAIALIFLLVRLVRSQKPTMIGMFWSLIATWLALEAGGVGKLASAYFGAAALILAGSIVENSYFLAYRDELTGLHSRRAFNDALLRLKPPYAIAAVDIDHFKNINDTYGHDTGDEVLRMVASKLARIGAGGESYRVGGEEFTILFPGKTGMEIVDYLELLRLNIEASVFCVRAGDERRKIERPEPRDRRSGKKKRTPPQLSAKPSSTLSVTVSIGIGESQPKVSSDEIINRADEALYKAKRSGRNRIETAMPERTLLGFRRKKTKQS